MPPSLDSKLTEKFKEPPAPGQDAGLRKGLGAAGSLGTGPILQKRSLRPREGLALLRFL